MAHHVKLECRVNLAPVLIEDMKEPLVSLFVEDQHTNPGTEQHPPPYINVIDFPFKAGARADLTQFRTRSTRN